MIARAWSASATPDGAAAYQRHFESHVLAELAEVPGYLDAFLLRREDSGRVELTVLSLWKSTDAIRRFAGPEYDTAVVHDDAKAVLDHYDTFVRHYSVAVAASEAGGAE
jgi:heme-degrading monooxygenase HmoA